MGDPGNAKSSELDRGMPRRTSTRLSHVLGVDDDDYDLEAMAISDGFQPAEVAQNHNASHVARPSVSSLEPPVARAMSPRPSSVSKPSLANEPYSLAYNRVERAPVRSSTMSTDPHTMPTETPYEGPSGPSHPYQMYPQDVRLARTASLATTSTAPISERSYNGPRRPAHPYGIYPQDVGAGVDGASDPSPQRQINPGFPGRERNYQRRIGPDGEEVADMIGPDGHTEQLPPYTRYPMEAYAQKAIGMNATEPAPAPPAPQQSLEIPGAGGIGLATRNPEFASTEDLNQLNSPQSRRSIRSFTSEASHHSINTAALAVTNEKSTPNWKTAARRKVWGVVPCWAVVLGVIVLVMLGVVVGTVIGTVLAPHLGKGQDHKPPYPATRPTPGFIPLSTVPPGLPPLALGQYSLPLLGPRFSNTCFKDPTQGQAWNCEAIMSQLTMSISWMPGATNIAAYALDFTYNSSYTMESFVYMYGVQPPLIINQQLHLVNDTFEPSRGAAWAFALPYNKTIILPEEFLTPYSNTTSADTIQSRMMFGSDFKRKGLAQSGDKPWICTWQGTLLEVFIYAGQNSSFKYPMYPTSPSSSSTTLPTGAPTSTGAQDHYAFRRGSPGRLYDDDDDDDDDYKDGLPRSHSLTPPPASSWTTSSTSSETTHTSSAKPDYFSRPPMIPPPFPPYPRIVKVEERRNAEIESPAPICSQVEITDKGTEARPVKDDKGNPIQIQISELMAEDTETLGYLFKRDLGQPLKSRGDDTSNGNELSDCGCIWWVT